METDIFCYQLLKQLPQTLFELLHLPVELSRAYRFDSVELKKSLRIDGLYLPQRSGLPLYFVEVQCQQLATFYANLFAKVFCYLHENDPGQDWVAVAIFANRRVEPKILKPYEALLNSPQVHRIYLEDYPMPADPPPGLGILQLLTAPETELKRLVARLRDHGAANSDLRRKVIELLEELLIRRFTKLDREEVRMIYELHALRDTKAWQQVHNAGVEEGVEKGIERGREEGKTLAKEEMVRTCLAKGMEAKEIAALFGMPLKDVRRMAKQMAK